jgi:hypothetical protein
MFIIMPATGIWIGRAPEPYNAQAAFAAWKLDFRQRPEQTDNMGSLRNRAPKNVYFRQAVVVQWGVRKRQKSTFVYSREVRKWEKSTLAFSERRVFFFYAGGGAPRGLLSYTRGDI